jgi:hypothetical protein
LLAPVSLFATIVQLCQPIIEKKENQRRQEVPSLLPDNAPTEALLKTLAGYNGAFERIGAAMRDIADIRREREVSWATIGEALAVFAASSVEAVRIIRLTTASISSFVLMLGA